MHVSPEDILIIRSRDEWRDWLFHNQSFKTEQWIAIFKKAYAEKGLLYDDAVLEALCFGWIDGLTRGLDKEKFIIRFTPRKKGSTWSLVNKKRALELIKKGLMQKGGLKTIAEAKESGWWEYAYSTSEKPKIPDYLLKELKQHESVWQKFNALSYAEQSRYISGIISVKKEETKLKKIQNIIDEISGL